MTEMEMIEGIPRFECSDGRPLEFEDDFFKDKLKKALTNTDIICLARGEGRNSVLNDIVISIPPPLAGGTNSNESVSTLYVVL